MEHQMLLEAYLKRLKLPAMLTHYQEMARQAEQGNQTFEGYLLALSELETQQRDENAFKRRVSQARFPLLKTLDQFDFSAIPSLNKAKVLNLAQGEYIRKKENLLLMGNSGTGKTHLATALGLTACQQGKKCTVLHRGGAHQSTDRSAGRAPTIPGPKGAGQARPVDHRRDRLCPLLGKRSRTLLPGGCRQL